MGVGGEKGHTHILQRVSTMLGSLAIVALIVGVPWGYAAYQQKHYRNFRVVREGVIATLPADAAAELEIPEGLGALIVPATCAGEPLGVLMLLFDGTPVIGTGALRALAILGTALGLALMQERLLSDEPGAGR